MHLRKPDFWKAHYDSNPAAIAAFVCQPSLGVAFHLAREV
jgi:hypothetical protein